MSFVGQVPLSGDQFDIGGLERALDEVKAAAAGAASSSTTSTTITRVNLGGGRRPSPLVSEAISGVAVVNMKLEDDHDNDDDDAAVKIEEVVTDSDDESSSSEDDEVHQVVVTEAGEQEEKEEERPRAESAELLDAGKAVDDADWQRRRSMPVVKKEVERRGEEVMK